MGVVHLALDPRGRAVAIKVLRTHIAHDDDARRRLGREVDTLSRIRDDRVASVIDADIMGPRPYIVTRYVPGPALDETVEEHGPLAPDELLRLARGVAEAIRAIHACGVVHRDIKPGNVLLEDGEPVLIDFGIAHLQDDVRHTVGGLVMGTPGYLSPELVEGAAITDATDWWGWAATITFAASGRPPFGRARMDAVLTRVRAGDVDLDGVDPLLVPLLRAALSPDPARRPHADDVIAALEQYAAGRAATVPPPRGGPWDDETTHVEPPPLAGVDPGAPGAQHVGDASRADADRVARSERSPGCGSVRAGGSAACSCRTRADRNALRRTGGARLGGPAGQRGADERRLLGPRRAGGRRRGDRPARGRPAHRAADAHRPARGGRAGVGGGARGMARHRPPRARRLVGHRPGHRPVLHVARAAPLRAGPSPQRRRDGGRHEPVAPRRRGRRDRGEPHPPGRGGARGHLRVGAAPGRHPWRGAGTRLARDPRRRRSTRAGDAVVGPRRGLPATRVALHRETPRAGRVCRCRSWPASSRPWVSSRARSPSPRVSPSRGIPSPAIRLAARAPAAPGPWGWPDGIPAQKGTHRGDTAADPKSKEIVKSRSRKDLSAACQGWGPHVPSIIGGLLHPEPDRGSLPFHVVACRARKPPARSTTSHGHPSIRSLSAPSLASQRRSPHRAGRARTGDPVWPACSDKRAMTEFVCRPGLGVKPRQRPGT